MTLHRPSIDPTSIARVADPRDMSISGTSLDGANVVAVRVQKIAQDQQKQEGQQAVQLIEQATPSVGPQGQGSHVNRYA